MPITNLSNLSPFSLSEGVQLRVTWGERMMVSVVTFEPNGVVPEHSHPHEQMGTVLEGEFELVIDGQAQTVRQGDIWHIPSHVRHSARALGTRAVALDIFSPSRQDYEARFNEARNAADETDAIHA